MKRFVTSNNAIALTVIFAIAIIYVVVLAFQSNNPISTTHNEQPSPIIIDLYIEEGKISPLLAGIIESGNVFADDMQKTLGEYSGWRRVLVEKGLVFRLRSIQFRPDWFYALYPDYSEFCMTKLTISPETKISDDRMITAGAGTLDSVERYKSVNGKIEPELNLELYEEFKGEACPTPSGTILFSDEQSGLLGLIPLYARRGSYYYPFDQHEMSFTVWVELSMKNKEGMEGIATITPEIKLSPLLQSWRVDATINNKDMEPTTFSGFSLAPDVFNAFARTTVDLKLTRPFVNRSLSIVIVVVAFVIILSLAFLKDHGVVVGTALTVVLGLWGAQNFIVPDTVESLTVMAPVVFSLYGLLVIVLVVRYTILFPITGFKLETTFDANPHPPTTAIKKTANKKETLKSQKKKGKKRGVHEKEDE